jgi:hypothetical protein
MNRIRSFRDDTANVWSHYGVWIAFALVVLVGGSNPVAVRFSNLELPPSGALLSDLARQRSFSGF